jgi:hypothetical protein
VTVSLESGFASLFVALDPDQNMLVIDKTLKEGNYSLKIDLIDDYGAMNRYTLSLQIVQSPIANLQEHSVE